MKIRKTICSLLLVCLTFLGIFAGRVNVYADQKQALSATVTMLKQEKELLQQHLEQLFTVHINLEHHLVQDMVII